MLGFKEIPYNTLPTPIFARTKLQLAKKEKIYAKFPDLLASSNDHTG